MILVLGEVFFSEVFFSEVFFRVKFSSEILADCYFLLSRAGISIYRSISDE